MRADTAYRALLSCYPAAFRNEYGSQMRLMFDEQLADARRSGRRLTPAALWARAILDTLIVAPKEHWHITQQDLRYALRTMVARPGFTIVAVLSLALGIGANTAIFSLWHGVIYAALPGVEKPEQLVMLTDPSTSGMWTGRWNGPTDGPRAWLTYAEFEQMRDHASVFANVMASQSSLNTFQVRFEGSAWEGANARLVSGGFFEVLGVRSAIGRVFTPEEDRSDSRTAVISYSYWQRRFGGDPGVLGKTFAIRTALLTIIGVTPAGFIGETASQQPDFWLPLRTQPAVLPGRDRLHETPPDKVMWLHVFGRLRPGVSEAQAEAEANRLLQANVAAFDGAAGPADDSRPTRDERLQIHRAAGGASPNRSEFSQSLTALLAAVGVLLLIACANLANLLLARGTARRTEIALRLSLGASRERLIRQLVTETLTLAAVGGVAAIAVAYVLHGALVRMLAESDSRFHMNFALDPLVLIFLAAVTVAAAVLCGVLPAWQATRTDAGATLKEQGRSASGSPGHLRPGRFLVSLQLALSLPLLIGAGLLARTVYNLQRADLGFSTERLLLARVDLREAADDDLSRRDGLRRDLLDRLQRIPGVRAVSFSHLGIFTGGNSTSGISVEGYTPKGDTDRESGFDVVGPGYFSTLGVPIQLGRDILESDHADSPRVCVVNDAFAQRFSAGRNPIGLRITESDEKDPRGSCQVVGVAGNAHTQTLRGEVGPRYFIPAPQRPSSASSPMFLLRTATDPVSVIAAVRKTIADSDAALRIMSVQSIDAQMAPLTAQDRTTAQLVIVFGGVALMLAAIGLYGVLSYGVARRTGEIAIRIALGAQSSRVILMILRETAGFVGLGVALGAGLAYAGSRLIDSRLYGVAPQDPLTFAAATGMLLLVALGAAYLPAARASKLNPMAALHQG